MRKTLTLAGKKFELMHTIDAVPPIRRRSLYECYERPSQRKQNIWVDWSMWFMDNNCHSFGVSSYNTMQFTIHGIFTTEDGTIYYLYITRDHNRAYEIV